MEVRHYVIDFVAPTLFHAMFIATPLVNEGISKVVEGNRNYQHRDWEKLRQSWASDGSNASTGIKVDSGCIVMVEPYNTMTNWGQGGYLIALFTLIDS